MIASGFACWAASFATSSCASRANGPEDRSHRTTRAARQNPVRPRSGRRAAQSNQEDETRRDPAAARNLIRTVGAFTITHGVEDTGRNRDPAGGYRHDLASSDRGSVHRAGTHGHLIGSNGLRAFLGDVFRLGADRSAINHGIDAHRRIDRIRTIDESVGCAIVPRRRPRLRLHERISQS